MRSVLSNSMPARVIISTVLCSLCLYMNPLTAAAQTGEIVSDLASKTDWSFRGDGGGQARTLAVPAGGWRLNGFPNVSSGTYERKILVPMLPGGQVTLLEFEAVNWEASVYAGPDASHLSLAGVHLSAWTPFRIDLSKYVSPGKPALVRVHVRDRNSFRDDSGRFTVPAGVEWNDRAGRGILRGVRLRVLPQVYVEDLFVKPTLAPDRTIQCSITVHNGSSLRKSARIQAHIGAATYIVKSDFTPSSKHAIYPIFPAASVTLEPGESKTISVGPVHWLAGKEFDWLPNMPFRTGYRAPLHQVLAEVSIPGIAEQAHKLSVRFGFCQFEQRDGRYRLNGIPINLRGDSLPEGTIGTDAFARLPGFLPPSSSNPGWPGAVQNYLKLNFNVLRMHQTPATRYMMDVCDELGLMVIPETAIRGAAAPENISLHPEAFKQQLEELVMRDRNHACVVKWSLENELPNVPAAFLQALYASCMRADGSRPCSVDGYTQDTYPDLPGLAYMDHNSQPAGQPDPAGGKARGNRPFGEGEYLWPAGSRPEGPVWLALGARSMRLHGNSDVRPYTLIDCWSEVIPGLSPESFPDPHLPPDSLEQGGRSLLSPASPWSDPSIKLIQNSFAPLCAFDLEYDRSNMHSNGRGFWPTTIPSLPGGTTTHRQFAVFNDEFSGEEVKLIIVPTLHLTENENQPLPEIVRSVHIPLGGRITVDTPLSVPVVARCSALNLMVTVWKAGKERYRETLQFVIAPRTEGGASATFAGLDTSTGGEWVDKSGSRNYGKEAFFIPIRGGRTLYQQPDVYLRRVPAIVPEDRFTSTIHDDAADAELEWQKTETTQDVRVPWTAPDHQIRQPVAFCGQDGKLFFRADCSDGAAHQLSIYILAFYRPGVSFDIDILDNQGHLLDSHRVDGKAIDGGVYVKYRVTGAVYVSIVPLGKLLPAVSGLFLDPVL